MRKIISIVIIGIFLLQCTSIFTVSTRTVKTTAPGDTDAISNLGLPDLKVKIQKSENKGFFTVVIDNKGESLDFLMLSYRIFPFNSDDFGFIEGPGSFSKGLNYYDIELPSDQLCLVTFKLFIHLDEGWEDATCIRWFLRIGDFIFALPVYKSLTIHN